MRFQKGLTLMEMVVVMLIIGILAAVAIPNYYHYIAQSKIQAVENNLRAIAAGQEKYYEDNNNVYCTPSTGCVDFGSINQHLSLTMSTDSVQDGFNYSCSSSGSGSTLTLACSATRSPVAPAGQVDQVYTDVNSNLTCFNNSSGSPVSVTCP